MRKKILVTGLIFVMVMTIFAGCGGKENDTGSDESASDESVQKVALLLPGSANDKSWNQIGYDALQLVAEETGAEVAFSENVSPTDQLQSMRDYAGKGYDVIIGHSGQYEDDMISIGEEFPDTQFVIIAGATGAEPNVKAVDTAPWQYGYAYGYIAGKVTKSNKVGFVTGMEGVATMNNLVGGFRDGAKAANPDVQSTVIYIKDMGDVAAAREAALSLKASGCDVIIHELNAGMQGVVDVCKENNIFTIGRSEADVEYAPEQVLTYTVFDWGPKYVDVVKQAIEGNVSGGFYFYGFNTPDTPGFEFNYDEGNPWNPNAVTPEILEAFQKDVVEMFQADPERTYTVDDAKAGTL
jgi:simple sugar transport system substrate-binding protein/basic membrane protein A